MSNLTKEALLANEHIREGEYWLEKLSGDFEKTAFPYDYEKKDKPGIKMKKWRTSFSNDLYLKIKKLSNHSEIRLFMIIVSGINILLNRYCSNNNIIVGIPIGKQEENIEFINTVLALKNEVSKDKTFKEILLSVRESIVEASENQNYPFDVLLYKLGMKMEDKKCPLFDTFVLLENIHVRKYIEDVKTNFNFFFNDTGNELELEIEYNPSFYYESTVVKVARHLENLLNKSLEDVNVPVKDIDIVDADEKWLILNKFNKNINSRNTRVRLNYLFEEQVKKTPNGIALQYDDKCLTYYELNQKANALARKLNEYGIGIENTKNIVGIMLERSLNMVISMLAVLKAGAAYLPIDVEYPENRKQFMIDDSKIEALIVSEAFDSKIKYDGLIIDVNNEVWYDKNVSNIERDEYANDLAYIIYTSGSVGKPKGVLIEHSSIINTLSWRKKFYGFSEKDTVLQIPSFSFDSSVEDIFTPLISGAKIVIVNQQNRFNVIYLSELMLSNNITNMLITPGLYKVLLQEYPESLQGLRVITIAGDSFDERLVKKHFQYLKKIRLINEYGPTENSVCTTAYEFVDENTRILVGKPIDNVRCYILDSYDKLSSVGFQGELCVAGNGLAKGYLNRPDLTLKKFVSNPINNNETIYRTGDMAKWLPDGNIEFLGRADYQLKIRGNRIELGEIEKQLLTNKNIKDTIVVDKEDNDGNKFLVQYFIADVKFSYDEVKSILNEALPSYMIPSYFVQLDKMPLTQNGKVDRRYLQENFKETFSSTKYEEPKNSIEIELLSLWKEVLNLDKIGVNDNFFEIGGHSLRATKLVSKIRKNLNVQVPLKEIFEKNTIRLLAEYIKQEEKRADLVIDPIKEERDYYPTTSAQKRIYLVNQIDDIGLTYNVPMSMTIDGLIDKEKTAKIFKQLVDRNEAFRTSFEFVKDELVQKISKDVIFKVEYMEANEEELVGIRTKFVRKFDLKKAPLLRVMLVNIENRKSMLLFDMHHIISDGVSMDILIEEFIQLYEGESLEKLNITYKDFAVWQEQYLKSEEVRKQKEYWLKNLSGDLTVLNMPTDYRRSIIQSFKGNKVRISLNKENTEALLKLAKETKSTLYIVLLAAYNVLLYRYSGQEDIIVGSPISGRTFSDIQNIIGMFINMIPLRNCPTGDKKFKDFINEVKEQSIEAFENQDFQFNDIVGLLNIDRSVNRNPLFNNMFALQNMEFRKKTIDNKKFVLADVETGISKFDISLIAVERGESIDLIFEYSTSLFKEETIKRLADHFTNIISSIVKNPDIQLKKIDLLDEAERNTLINEFNNTTVDNGLDSTINQIFKNQVMKTPNNIAVVYKNEKLTYKELDDKSDFIANILRNDYGVRSDDIVSIIIDESIDMFVSIIGIIKSGAAYLPIDMRYPTERIKYMLDDSRAKLVLTDSKVFNLKIDLFKEVGIETINLDELEFNEINNKSVENINKPEDLAYVIYTSGSTGKPKGVMVEHKALINLCKWHIKEFGVTGNDKATKYAGFGFDASVWEIFPYILSGATIHIIEESIKLDTVKLNEYYNDNEITISFLPTPICKQFIDLNNKSLRILLTGGDKLNNFISKSYRIVNNYGPTENTVVTTSFVVDRNYDNIPIGKPIDNTKIYIMDKNNNLQPIGVPGELCISGDSLSRGYLNNSKLTEEKFVVNPFDRDKMLYHTGDLARMLLDGNIEFIGRIDRQVKIRGNRIEIDEIQNVLLGQDAIKEAVVVAKEDAREDKYIVAYIITEARISTLELKEYLSKYLPSYMIPTYFVTIDKLPINDNGKIDFKLLPEVCKEDNCISKYVKPSSNTENILVDIWKEVLDIEKIGVNDNFFDIGGNSLLIMKVINKICSKFNDLDEKITVMTMFERPTIALMAKEIDIQAGLNDIGFKEIDARINRRKKAKRMNGSVTNE